MKTWVMTGASSGFGVEWLYELDRRQEARWFLLVREPQAMERMLRRRPLRGAAELIRCDLSSAASVNSAMDAVSARTDRLDGLINNAGLFPARERRLTEDGIEACLAVNVLAPHRLLRGLLPLLRRGDTPRVVTTASFRHRDGRLDRQNLQLSAGYSAQRAYSNSKLSVVLWTRALGCYLGDSGVAACCFDPGIVDTPMLRQATPRLLRPLFPVLRPLVARSPARGAETGVALSATANPWHFHGQYVKNGRVRRPHRAARDDAMAKWIWQQCELLTAEP